MDVRAEDGEASINGERESSHNSNCAKDDGRAEGMAERVVFRHRSFSSDKRRLPFGFLPKVRITRCANSCNLRHKFHSAGERVSFHD